MNSGTRNLLAVTILFLALVAAASAPLTSPPPAQAVDPLRPAPQVIDLDTTLAKAGFAAFKARFVDRREGFRTIKESQAEAVKILEQQKAQAEWWASKGYITADQAAAASRGLDQIVLGLEELAKQERRMVRNDTRFLKTFVRTLGRSLTESAPQLLSERFGLPPLGARIAGAIIQGEKPATAALDALITKLSGGELVAPSKEPFEDLLKQVDALQEAASVLRGADRVKLLGELFGVRKKLEEITGLPIPEQSEELDKLRDLFAEAEGTIGELGKVRDGWVPKYAGPSSERFQNNPQWQAIYQEMLDRGESPELVIKAAVAAGMSLAALEKVKAELIAQGIDLDSKDLDLLAAQVIRERIRADANGDPITNEQAVQNMLGGDPPDTSGEGVPASPDDDQQPAGDDPKPADDPPREDDWVNLAVQSLTAGLEDDAAEKYGDHLRWCLPDATAAGLTEGEAKTDCELPWTFEGTGLDSSSNRTDFGPAGKNSASFENEPFGITVTIHPDGTVVAIMVLSKGMKGGSCSNPNPDIRGTREVTEFDPPLVVESGETLGDIGSWIPGTFRFPFGFPAKNFFEGPYTRLAMSGLFTAGGTFEGPCGTTVSSQTQTFVEIARAD